MAGRQMQQADQVDQVVVVQVGLVPVRTELLVLLIPVVVVVESDENEPF